MARHGSNRKNLTAKDVINKLKEENVFNEIFGAKYHIQLVQRADELIQHLLYEKEFSDVELGYLWSATQKDGQTKMEVLKIIKKSSS